MLLAIGGVIGLVWFSQQFVQPSEPAGLITIDAKSLPQPNGDPVFFREHRFVLTNTDNGLLALIYVVPNHWCLVNWSHSNHRFEDPCYGAKFQLDGTFIEGPSARDLDRYPLAVVTNHGEFFTPSDGLSVPADGATSVVVDINRVIRGAPRFRSLSGQGS